MKREPLMTPAYFAQAITDIRAAIVQRTAKLDDPGASLKKPQILAHANFTDQCELLLSRYSAGEPVTALTGDLKAVVAAWERWLACAPPPANDLRYLDDYVRSLWIVSLGLIFRVSDALWHRNLACAGDEGQDRLFERLAACRTAGRRQTDTLLHPRAYTLLDQAATQASAPLMARFLTAWYPAMREIG